MDKKRNKINKIFNYNLTKWKCMSLLVINKAQGKIINQKSIIMINNLKKMIRIKLASCMEPRLISIKIKRFHKWELKQAKCFQEKALIKKLILN